MPCQRVPNCRVAEPIPQHTKPGSSTSKAPSPNPLSKSSFSPRYEWHSHDDSRFHLNCSTTNSQAASDRPRSYPAIRVGAPAASRRPKRQVEKEGRAGSNRPRGDVREPEESHRGSRGRGGSCGRRGTTLWCVDLHTPNPPFCTHCESACIILVYYS